MLRASRSLSLGNDQQVGATVQAMKPGEVSDVLQAGNKLAIVVVTGTSPAASRGTGRSGELRCAKVISRARPIGLSPKKRPKRPNC